MFQCWGCSSPLRLHHKCVVYTRAERMMVDKQQRKQPRGRNWIDGAFFSVGVVAPSALENVLPRRLWFMVYRRAPQVKPTNLFRLQASPPWWWRLILPDTPYEEASPAIVVFDSPGHFSGMKFLGPPLVHRRPSEAWSLGWGRKDSGNI